MYPNEESLDKIRKWQVLTDDDYIAIMEYARDLWYYPDMFRNDGKKYTLTTCGWSGNEEVIGALNDNIYVRMSYWYSSTRGGVHVYIPISWIKNELSKV